MRIPSASALLILLLFSVAAREAQAGRFVLFERTWGDCIVVTDMTKEGRALKPASREHPVYFLGKIYGSRLGSMPGDRLPDAKEMGQLVTRILAKQGYLAAQPGVHEAELFLAVQWGRIDPRSGDSLWFLGYNPRDDVAAPTLAGRPGIEIHFRNMRSREIEAILDYAEDDIYGIIISAFEYKSAFTSQPVILWQTRIGLPANGKGMTEAITAMAQIAGPQIGRETTKPILRNMDDRFTTSLGELEVIGFEDDVSDSGADK